MNEKEQKPTWCWDEKPLAIDGVPYYRWREMPREWREEHNLNPVEFFESARIHPVIPHIENEKRDVEASTGKMGRSHESDT